MNEQQWRTPPDDPWNITLTYRHDQRWWFDSNEEPESWHVSADVLDDSGTHVESHVGDMNIVVVDFYPTRDPFGLLDGEDADLGAIAGTVFDARTGELDPDLDDLLEPLGDRILILNSVRLTPEWRGFGLGVLLAGTAIKKLSGGVRAAVCYPAPINEPADGEPDSPPHVSRPSRHSAEPGPSSDSSTSGTASTSSTSASSLSMKASDDCTNAPSSTIGPADDSDTPESTATRDSSRSLSVSKLLQQAGRTPSRSFLTFGEDKLDAVWQAKLTQRGMLRPSSSRPPRYANCGTTPGCAPT